MTELLERAIAQLKTLPADEEDALAKLSEGLAARLLAELEDDRVWKTQFESTTDEQWDRMAALVKEEIAAGDLAPLDEVFPARSES
ncbi:MAG: hypothetical protein KME17_18640 [Cyanosarcina radialis HA8281-LM2]|jgi:hypothetical protein|nr:hypothetical protein [Cyanosarcina radialis HA8281-LM2]